VPLAADHAPAPPETAASLARCLGCLAPLEGATACPSCGRPYPLGDNILSAIAPLTGRNRIAAAFYDGPHWPRFRPWERLFLAFQGGQRGARRQILRHLPDRPGLRVLEVGIGDGENVPLLPRDWSIFGVDIARSQLEACLARFPDRGLRLAHAQAEELPFPDGSFDAVFFLGGFNYVSHHARAIAEMRRVARPDDPVIVADEIPSLTRFTLGRLLGLDFLNTLSLRALGLDRDFVRMVLSLHLDLDRLATAFWPSSRRYPIWNRLGYCLVEDRRRPSRAPIRPHRETFR
jgi:SAM-dependent methyltransferase